MDSFKNNEIPFLITKTQETIYNKFKLAKKIWMN